MPAFEYTARRTAGGVVTGVVEAASQREVLQRLAEQSLFPVRITEAAPAARGVLSQRRVAPRHVATLYRQLADLLRSGVPLLRSLDILERQASHPKLAAVLGQLRGDVAEGTSLADAMARHPRVFTDLASSMVRAGQEGGFLEDVLGRIADFTDHQEEVKSRVLGAMIYPAFLLGVTFVVLIVMLTVFVPRFQPIFERMRETNELPVLTDALLATSSFLQRHWLLLLFGGVVAGAAVAGWLRSEPARLVIDRMKLRMPGFRHIWRGLAVARFTRILGTLLANGISILTALRIAKDSAGNRVLAAVINDAADHVAGGNALAGPLRASGQFPPDVIEMIAVGEESNSLDRVLVNIAEATERRITRQVDLLVRMLEPVLLLVMALVVLLVVAALLMPVFNASTMI